MVDETITLVLGVILGFAAAVVYELKYIINIDKKIQKMLEKLEAMEAKELKLIYKEEKMLEKLTKKKSKSKPKK
jgi:hypothetical protein